MMIGRSRGSRGSRGSQGRKIINTPSRRPSSSRIGEVVTMQIHKVAGAHNTVMGRRMMFGEVISEIVRTTAPMNDEIALGNATTHPVKNAYPWLWSNVA